MAGNTFPALRRKRQTLRKGIISQRTVGSASMDIEKTKAYYAEMTFADLCPCECCQYYARHIKAAYPQIAKYLAAYGVDIEKPLETMYVEEFDKGFIFYWTVQYVVIGDEEGFREMAFGDVSLYIEKLHPQAMVQENYFVVSLGPVTLNYAKESYK